MTQNNLPSINGLRAVSIILVIISHLENKYGIFKGCSDSVSVRLLINFLHDGNLGVNVFFVVSGFLITSMLLQEESQYKKNSIQRFYIRRALRIFPAYYFLLLVYFILQRNQMISIMDVSWFSALTFTKYFNWFLDLITSHLWSLSVEENFYLFFPFVFIGGNSFRKKTMIFLFLIVPFLRIAYHFTQNNLLNDLSIFTRIDAISIGCICAFYKDWIITKISPRWSFWISFSISILIGLRLLNLLAYEVDLEILFVPFGVTAGSFANICIAIIMMYSVFGPNNKWHRFLNIKYVTYFGVLSYSIYLWQQIFIFGKFTWLSDSIPLRLLLTLLMALFSYYLIEKPFLKLKSKFSNSNLL